MTTASGAKIAADSFARQLNTSLAARANETSAQPMTSLGPEDPRSFIDWAYRTILGRSADLVGSNGLLQAIEGGLPRPIALARLATSEEALDNASGIGAFELDRPYRELQLTLHFSGVAVESEAFAWVLAAHEVLTGAAPSTVAFLADYLDFLERRSARTLIRRVALAPLQGSSGVRRLVGRVRSLYRSTIATSAERRVRASLPLYRTAFRLHDHISRLEQQLVRLDAALGTSKPNDAH
jgi:hypothetical protein